MTYFDDYKLRLQNYGVSSGEAMRNSTINLINNAFADSPFYASININSIPTDVRIIPNSSAKQNRDNNIKILLFRPNVNFNKGSYVVIGADTWIITDNNNDTLYPKSVIGLCNNTLKWIDENNVIKQYPCIINSQSNMSTFDLDEGDKVNVLPQGEMRVHVQYNSETKLIKNGTRLLFSGDPFRVSGYDKISHVYNNAGLLVLFVKVDILDNKDDLLTNIANNEISSGKIPGVTGTYGANKIW